MSAARSRRAATPAPQRAAPPRAAAPTARAAWTPPLALVRAAPLVALVAVHGGALSGFFAADDIDFLMRARGLDPTPWPLARLLPGAWRWQAMTALFGANPLPHLALAFALHGACALLATRIALRAGLGRVAAMGAGTLVAATSIAYASTHWASGLGEVLATALTLAALALHVECRHRRSPALAWLAGLSVAAAILSKESAILAPAALWLFDRLVPVTGAGRGAMREVLAGGGLAAAAAVAVYVASPHVGGEAYALSWSPAVWLTNLGTYAAWLVRLTDPIRDRVAQSDPSLRMLGLSVLALWGAGAWLERRAAARPITAGLAWFVLLLAPVLLLERHTYLYYLVAPWVGVSLALAAVLERAAARLPAAAAALVVLAAAGGFTANEAVQILARRQLQVNGVPVDRITRESTLLRQAVRDLRAAGLTAADSVAFINPYPIRSMDASTGKVREAGAALSRFAYIPFVHATREGRALALFVDGPVVLGTGDGIPPEWERARILRYGDDGSLTDLGRGADALEALSEDYVRGERWSEARAVIDRLLAMGRDGAELRWRLGRIAAAAGDEALAMEQARVILARWPESPRAKALRDNAARTALTLPGAAPR